MGKLSRDGAEALAIHRFDALQCYVEVGDRAMNKLGRLRVRLHLEVDEGSQIWYFLRYGDIVLGIADSENGLWGSGVFCWPWLPIVSSYW